MEWRRPLVAVVIASVLAAMSPVLFTTPAYAAPSVLLTDGHGCVSGSYTVAPDVHSVTVMLIGGNGQQAWFNNTHYGGGGGRGGKVIVTFAVTPGQTIYAGVGLDADDVYADEYGSGYDTGGNGGRASDGNANNPGTYKGGKGGSLSWISFTNPVDASGNCNLGNFIAVAGAGGGGGTSGEGGAGGAAGQDGNAGDGNSSPAGGPGYRGTNAGPGASGAGGHYFYLFTSCSAQGGWPATGLRGGLGGGNFGRDDKDAGGGGGGGFYGGGGGGAGCGDGGGGGAGGANYAAPGTYVTANGVAGNERAQIVITPITTPTVTLTSSKNPASQGTPVTFTINVSPATTGNIELNVDIPGQICSGVPPFDFCFPWPYTTLATIPLVNGVATYTTSSLPVRNNLITANFIGHDDYAGTYKQVTESIVAAVSVINQSADQTARYGDSIYFTYGAPGGTAQQWQSAHVTSTTPILTYGPWGDIAGATSNTLTVNAREDLTKYRALVTNGADTVMTREFLLHVTPAPLQIVGTSQTVPFGSAPAALSATFVGLKFNDTPALFSGSYTATAPTLSTEIGSYAVHVTGNLANPNYSPITYADGTITVTTRPVTISTDELTSEFGAPPPFTAHAANLVNGDTLASLGTLTFTPAPAVFDPQYAIPGDYQVTPGGLPDNPHYTFAYVAGAWHVRDTTGPAAPSLTTFIPFVSGQFRGVAPGTWVGYGQASISWSAAYDLWGVSHYLGLWVDCTTHQPIQQIFDTQIVKTGWTIIVPSYPEEVRCLSIQGIDGFGNYGQLSDPWKFIVDFTPPPVSVAFADGVAFIPGSGGQPPVSLTGTPTFLVTTEAGATLGVSIQDAASNVLMSVAATAGPGGTLLVTPDAPLPEGVITVFVSATDEAGNSSGASFALAVDHTPPQVSVTATLPNAHGWNKGPVLVEFTATDAESGLAPGTDHASVTLSTDGADQSATRTFTDRAGNVQTATVSGINIDTALPTISGSRTPANADGWNKGSVTVTFTCGDALSGIDTCSAPTTLSGEGAGQSVTGTAKDKAGNAANATVSGINIDKTAPEITVQRVPGPNAFGWNNVNVTVAFSCTDPLSGLADCSDVVTLGEGAGQSATGTATDRAGNSSSLTVTGINVDKTKPTIGGTRTPANVNGWNNAPVTVTFTCDDALSGIASCSAPTTLSGDGAGQSVTGNAADKAGNGASETVSGVNIDRTAPTITGARTPAANADGWSNTDVTASFTCADALSGVAACTAPQTFGEGADQTANGSVTDRAGNGASTSVAHINVDKTAPTITSSRTAANANGWNMGDVTVSFSCADALSGLASCGAPVTLTGEGADQSVTGNAADKAGNTASATASDIRIDKTAPTISASRTPPANGNGWSNSDVTVTFACGDALSGVESCSAPQTFGEGAEQTASGSVTDRAGNSASTSLAHISVDKTVPTISSARTTANANGWNNTDVTVTFSCGDALSGLAACSSAVTLSGEGAGQSVTGTASDRAGNAASTTASGINIDKTAPRTTATPDRAPNASGWYNAAVSVALSCADALAGCAATQYSLDGGSWTTYSTPVLVAHEATHTLQYRSTDRAGNLEVAGILTLQLDFTSPEGVVAFDTQRLDLVVTPRSADDSVTVVTQPGPSSGGSGAQQSGSADRRERRTYRLRDRADNTLEIVIDVRLSKTSLSAVVVSATYGDGSSASIPENELRYDWSANIKTLDESIKLGKGVEVDASYKSDKNETTITQKGASGDKKTTRPGLVLIRLVTDRGELLIQSD